MIKHLLPAPVNGIIASILLAVNILSWSLIIFIFALLRFIPFQPWQKYCQKFLHKIPRYWAEINNSIISLTTDIDWQITGAENLQPNDWYFLICNHQSWIDILVLGYVFNQKIPTLKFFMKKELLWGLPFAGFAASLVGFPIMHRHSKSFIAKHPDQKGQDIEITRKACEKFKNTPTTVITFIEGTRLTKEKQQTQTSPYQYLLRPKAGGIAFALATMGEYFHNILDVTIVYPNAKINFWDFFCGRIKKVIVNVNLIPITPDLLGDYENNREYRVFFHHWLNDLWQKKDNLIRETMAPK